jgi:hypothetical protein
MAIGDLHRQELAGCGLQSPGGDDGMTLSIGEDTVADHDLCVEHVEDLSSGGASVADHDLCVEHVEDLSSGGASVVDLCS